MRLHLPRGVQIAFAAGEFHVRFVQTGVVDCLPDQIGNIHQHVEVFRRELGGWILGVEVNHAKRFLRRTDQRRWLLLR